MADGGDEALRRHGLQWVECRNGYGIGRRPTGRCVPPLRLCAWRAWGSS